MASSASGFRSLGIKGSICESRSAFFAGFIAGFIAGYRNITSICILLMYKLLYQYCKLSFCGIDYGLLKVQYNSFFAPHISLSKV